MVFRRGANSTKVRPTITAESPDRPSSNINLSSSPLQPLLVSHEEQSARNALTEDPQQQHSKDPILAMMEEGNTHNEALVSNDDNLESSPYLRADTFEPSDEEVSNMKLSQQRWNLIIFSIGSAAFFFALTSMVVEMSTLIVFCFAFPLVLGPYMIRQRRIMNRFPALSRLINRLRFQTNRLQMQNNIFAAENTRLEIEKDRLKQVEFQLHQICLAQGTNINELQRLIKEKGAIQQEMNKLLDAQELHQILQVILVSDTNQDFEISDEEFHQMTMRLKCFSVVDEERLKQALRMSSVKYAGNQKYNPKPTEHDFELTNQGALTGLEGWMV